MRSDLSGRRERDAGDRFGMASVHEARKVLEKPWKSSSAERVADALPLIQGGYYLATGLWPLVHMRSFEAVTGPKTDRWLVRTVGTMAAAIGAGLLMAGRRGYLSREMRATAQLAALGFASVEVPTAVRGRISPIYLADAAVELGFIGAHAWAAGRATGPGDRLERLANEQADDLLA